MPNYINFYFDDLTYDDSTFLGQFRAPDYDVKCEFEYDRKSGKINIWNNNKTIEEIGVIPIWFLNFKLQKNGVLNEKEYKISF